MRHEIGRTASEDLRALHGFGIQKYGPRAADAYIDELFAKFEQIAQWPFAAQVRHSAKLSIRLVRHRAHNIFYSVENETVIILRLFHHSVNWADQF